MRNFITSKPASLLEAYLPLVLWASIIFFFSSQQTLPGVDSSVIDFLFKKCAHMTVYAVLYYLTTKALYFHLDTSYTKYWYLPIILCFIYAVTDELHQSFVPYRSPTIGDLGYDMLGVTLVFLKQYRYI